MNAVLVEGMRRLPIDGQASSAELLSLDGVNHMVTPDTTASIANNTLFIEDIVDRSKLPFMRFGQTMSLNVTVGRGLARMSCK